MQTASGLCLRACSMRSSALLPAARPTSWRRSGRSSTTLTVLVPMEPVLPRRTTFFIRIPRSHHDVAQVEIHERRIEQQAIHQVQNSADAGEELAGIFNARFALEKRFDQVAQNGGGTENDAEDGGVENGQFGHLLLG